MSSKFGLLCFAFGVARGRSGGTLSGPVLVRLLADLGLSESAARSLILRMRREGWLISTRSGRVTHYRLASIVTATEARLERQLRGVRPQWDGGFAALLYSVAERDRAFRDRLRRSAQLAGYATLRPGLLLASTDRWDDLEPVLQDAPKGSQLLRGRLELSEQDSRRVAGELWHLVPLAARYRSVMRSAVAAIQRAERGPARGRQAFAAFAAATMPLYAVSAADPDLPTQLLPADWPGTELGSTIADALRVFGPLLSDYLDQLQPDGDRADPDRLGVDTNLPSGQGAVGT